MASAALPFGESAQIERRKTPRTRFIGSEVHVFTRWSQIAERDPTERFLLQLRDMSLSGLSGLIDAPLNVGDLVFVQLDEMLVPAAEVIWFRRAMTGFRLVQPLHPNRFRALKDRHFAGQLWSPAMRMRAELALWMSDAALPNRAPTEGLARSAA